MPYSPLIPAKIKMRSVQQVQDKKKNIHDDNSTMELGAIKSDLSWHLSYQCPSGKDAVDDEEEGTSLGWLSGLY